MDEKDKAVEYFNAGYNCAESLLMAFSEKAGITADEAKKIASGFGGGTGGTHENMCGAVNAAIVVLGLTDGGYAPDDAAAKKNLYGKVSGLIAEFKERNASANCRELLGFLANEKKEGSAPKTAGRPCGRFVADAAELLAKKVKTGDYAKGESV
ncbi:MAG: C-GCAxxG-C-C family protein [Clostridiales bacterium]|jgi:C_GCAxxG_C_C family probable redox protein|nr:C-GCAxxG-C-C family protein [Clostridiales bacterium]